MIVRSSRPADLEMPLDGFREWITPVDRFFVRCHTYFPERANLSDWRLKVDGVVNLFDHSFVREVRTAEARKLSRFAWEIP